MVERGYKKITEILDTLPEENRSRVLNTMKRYGKNHWWMSDDTIEIATYQLFEPILLVDFGAFHSGLEKLLGRPVFTHELGLNYGGLKQEASQAIARREMGFNLEQTNEYQSRKVKESFKLLEDYGKKVIVPDMGKVEALMKKGDVCLVDAIKQVAREIIEEIKKQEVMINMEPKK